MRLGMTWLLGMLALAAHTGADPTWPSSIDELEEIMFQTDSVNSRKFADSVSPCSNQASGPGRRAAAEWLRTAFHDMATHSRLQQVGGLDGSLQYELTNGDNSGPAFATTFTFMAPYVSRKSSLADLIALGVYTSVRTCGGPAVPIRAGRIDAMAAGGIGVPQPQNAIGIFRNQFTRMGFTNEEMIQVTACGHTLGSVHSSQFPEIVPPGTQPGDQIPLDSTVAVFDNRVVTEYLNWTTTNPLVVGPAVQLNRHSDWKVFSSDSNATMTAMADPTAFQSTCRAVLQKMIDTVPAGVTLTDPIQPYNVKPVDIQLTLGTTSAALEFSGSIRIRTTEVPRTTLAGLTINYKNRSGGTSCGSGPCSFTVAAQGLGRGINDEFVWFPFSVTIPVNVGISSFTITIRRTDGSTELHDNNGNEYPVQDVVFLQRFQSCLLQTSGIFTLTAAVRNDHADLPVSAFVSYKINQSDSVVPRLTSMTLQMTKGNCNGAYTFFSVSTTIPGGHSAEADFDIISGTGSSQVVESFKKTRLLGGTCRAFTTPGTCSVPGGTSSTTSQSPSSSTQPPTSSRPPTLTTSTVVSTTSSSNPVPSLHHREVMGGYRLVSCWTEGVGARALNGPVFVYSSMTLESCMSNCTGFDYWGTEYGIECYCGNSLHGSSSSAPLAECNMVCGGDNTQYCGAGNRLELYSTTATRSTSSTSTSSAPTPTGTLARTPTVGRYSLVGCQTEGTGVRALTGASLADDNMTLEMCASHCSAFTYFGTEYGRECYCGNSLHSSSNPAAEAECNMVCAGNPFQYCGAGSRLELYRAAPATLTTSTASPPASISSSSSSVSLTSSASTVSSVSTTSSTPTGPYHRPTIDPFTLVGCQTEGSGARALSGKTYTSGTALTLSACAEFCAGFRYFGTEYSAECYCGNALHASSSAAPLSECSMTCSGDVTQFCGGPDRLTLYENPGVGPEEPNPDPRQPAVAGDFVFYGCRTEPAGARALGARATAAADMTNEACAEFCADYEFFGTEYGAECYCGDELHAGSEEVDEGQCNMLCSGAEDEFCGAGNRLSVYVKQEEA